VAITRTIDGEPGGVVARSLNQGLDARTGGGLSSNTYRTNTQVEGGQGFGFLEKGAANEAAYRTYTDEQAAKNSTASQLGEIFVDPIKNLGAGVINSIVPGSNLGDSNNAFRSIGEAVGGVAGVAIGAGLVNVAVKGLQLGGAVATLEKIVSPVVKVGEQVAAPIVRAVESIKAPDMGFLDDINEGIRKANEFIVSPIGQKIIPALNPVAKVPVTPNIPAGAQMPVADGPIKLLAATPSGTTMPSNQAMPSWVLPLALAAAAYVILKKR